MTIIAHRGLHHAHPENSREALHAAWDAGFQWCEIDIRGSSDHQPFLMHDETLERTTAGTGAIDLASADALFHLGVPMLRELIESMPAQGRLLVEIKPKVSHETVDRTLEVCDPARCIVQSFDAELLLYAADRRKDFELHLLVDDAKAIEGGPWYAINADFGTLDAASAANIRNLGFGVGAWTPNTPADMRRMIDLKVDRIITDQPILLRDILKQIG